jgi:hypothetical protein
MLIPGCPCCGTTPCWDGETFSTGSTQASSTGYLGGGFVTPSGGLTLTSVTIYQSGGLGEPLTYSPPPNPQPTNAPRLRILNDDSGVPNSSSVVATLTRPTDWTTDEWVWTHAGLSLTGSTTYWVELSSPGTQTMRWKWDGYPFAEGPTDECYYLRSTSTNSGTTWSSGTDTIRFLFDLN